MEKLGKLFLKMLFFVFVVAILGGGIYAFVSGKVTFGPPAEQEPCKHAKYTLINDDDPTCLEGGYTGDKKCDACGEIFEKGQATAPSGHMAREIPAVEPTCTANGNTAGSICAICSTYIITPTTIEKKSHNVVDTPSLPATCTNAGSVGGKHCTVCSTVIEDPDEKFPATGHTYLTVAGFAATCVEKGLTDARVCSVCNKTLEPHREIPIDSTNHVSVIATDPIAPTCTDVGYENGTHCESCSAVVVEPTVIDALGHDEVVVPGYAETCMKTGLTDGSFCQRCETTTVEQVVIDIDPTAHHHVVVIEAKDATCFVDGCTEGLVCDNADDEGNTCGDTIESQVIEHGHNVTEWTTTIEPTTDTAGEQRGHCDKCGNYIYKDIPATDGSDNDLGNIPEGDEGLV